MNPWKLIKEDNEATFNPDFSSILEIIERSKTKEAIVAVSENPQPITYTQLAQYMRKTISFLKNKLTNQDTIAFSMDNKPELLVISWSAWSANFRTTPLDIKRDTFERKIYKLKETKAKILFVRSDQNDMNEIKQIQQALPELEIIILDNDKSYFDLISSEDPYSEQLENAFANDCLILFTSGTTGLPKGARLTQKSLCADALQIVDWLEINSNDRFHIVLPLHHINSTTFSLATILAQGTIVLSPKYSKKNFWKIMADYKATCASIVPTIAYDLVSEEESFHKHKTNISRIQIGSAPVQPNVVRDFYQKFKIMLIQGFGSTETSLRCTGVPYPLEEKEFLETVAANSIGQELIWNNVTILDKQGNQVQENEEGDICVRGPNVMQGYLNNPDETKNAFQFDWFHMGDLGYYKIINNRKLFFLKGRSKEIIIKGGINISPLAIENTILHQYNIDFCYVFGFDHPRFGEEIAIVCNADKTEIEKLTQDIENKKIPNLSEYEHPKVLLITQRETLPKTSTGKIQRSVIKKQFSLAAKTKYLTVANNQKFSFRIIEPSQEEIIRRAVEIHNSRWPESLATNFAKIQSKAKNGFLLGIFEKENNVLLGTISGLKIPQKDILDHKDYTQTWDSITNKGTFTTNVHKADCIVCTAITIAPKNKNHDNKPSSKKEDNSSTNKEVLDENKLNEYIPNDPVIKFHLKNKADLDGAKIIQVIRNGRREDSESLGYNVLLQYNLAKKPSINQDASPGTQLLEAALLFAFKQKITSVVAYSRPSGLSKHFTKSEP